MERHNDDKMIESDPLLDVEMDVRSAASTSYHSDSRHGTNRANNRNNKSRHDKVLYYEGRGKSSLSSVLIRHSRSICFMLVAALVVLILVSRSFVVHPKSSSYSSSSSSTEPKLSKLYDPKSFARENRGAGVHTHLQQYEATRASCFKSNMITNVTVNENSATQSQGNQQGNIHHHHSHKRSRLHFSQKYSDLSPLPEAESNAAQADARVATCTLPTEDSTWHIQRVGPFVTRGNGTWNNFGFADVMDLSKTVFINGQRDERAVGRLVRARMMAPVDERGNVLAYPPIHIHHWHLVPEWANYGFLHTVWAQAHGDSQCGRGKGWTDCLLQTEPRGFALELRGPMHTDADFVDARQEPDAAPLSFYLEMALEILNEVNDTNGNNAPPSDKKNSFLELKSEASAAISTSVSASSLTPEDKIIPLQLLSLGNPFRMNATMNTIRMQMAQLYFVPPNDPVGTVIWYSSRFLASGTFFWTYLHSHQPEMGEALVIAAHPNKLGLNQGDWVLEQPWEPLSLKKLGMKEPEDVVNYLEKSMRRHGLSVDDVLKCHFVPHVEGKVFGRRLIGCVDLNGKSRLPWKFKRGDETTIVAISRPNLSNKEYAMHTILRGLVHFDRKDTFYQANRREFEGIYVFSAPDPRYQLTHNAFMSFAATLKLGGSPLSPYVRDAEEGSKHPWYKQCVTEALKHIPPLAFTPLATTGRGDAFASGGDKTDVQCPIAYNGTM